jgi:hypothetical protein
MATVNVPGGQAQVQDLTVVGPTYGPAYYAALDPYRGTVPYPVAASFAAPVDSVVFPARPTAIRLIHLGQPYTWPDGYKSQVGFPDLSLYFTVDGSTPTPGAPNTYRVRGSLYAEAIVGTPGTGALTVKVSLGPAAPGQAHYTVQALLGDATEWPRVTAGITGS